MSFKFKYSQNSQSLIFKYIYDIFLFLGQKDMLEQYIERVADGLDRGKYKCGMCGKINGQKIHTQNHIESFHFPGTFEYNCKHCHLTFTGRNKLYFHVYQVHKGLKY